jgi:hypothetical protein
MEVGFWAWEVNRTSMEMRPMLEFSVSCVKFESCCESVLHER